jgi:hypothetical protein
VARVLSTTLVLVLLAATAAAFALTERAKLEHSPIYAPVVSPTFSPDGTSKPVAHIQFRVRPRERIDVWVQDAKGRRVAELLANRNVSPHTLVKVVWDAFTSSGLSVPDGVYQPVVKLIKSHRTIVLPSDIVLDTRPPAISAHPATKYPILSPDGDGRHDVFRIPYRIDEHAKAILLMRGTQVVKTKGQKQTGELVWNGFRPHSTVPLPPGRYVLEIAALDRAGNRSKGAPFAIAQIRYVALARKRVVVRPGGRFALRVSTDAPSVAWRLHGASGTQRAGTLHFRAPRSTGVYRLYVTVRNHTAVCAVVVA